MNEKFTAWCGLCCIDCIPSNKDLFNFAYKLKEKLSYLQFDEYAKLKAEKILPLKIIRCLSGYLRKSNH